MCMLLKTLLCWKSMLKISACVEICNACWKLCLKFQHMLILSERFQGMLKTVIWVENYVETTCWKFQCALKTVNHVENYVEISRCVENIYVRHVENHVEVQKKHYHTLRCMLKLSSRFHFSSLILHILVQCRHIMLIKRMMWMYTNIYIKFVKLAELVEFN